VDLAVIGLVAISAVLHVAWNVRLKTAGDPLRAATIGMVAAGVVIVPIGAAAWWATGAPTLPPEGIALGLMSGLVECGYFVLLSGAYRRGDLSVVYPIARGTAPLLAVAIGVGWFGEHLGVVGAIGVGLLFAGFLLLQRPWEVLRGRRGIDPAVAFALATGVTIALYSAIDRAGTRLIADPAAEQVDVRRAAIGGFMTLAAYLLILVALSVAPLSGVAPLRESATVFAAAWGSVALGEAADRGDAARRILASVAIVAGALCLAVGL
jgi:uncharacterized membrane protein